MYDGHYSLQYTVSYIRGSIKGGRGPCGPTPWKIKTSWINIVKLPNLSLGPHWQTQMSLRPPGKVFWIRACFRINQLVYILLWLLESFIAVLILMVAKFCSMQENSAKLGSYNSWSRYLQHCWFTAVVYDCISLWKHRWSTICNFIKEIISPKMPRQTCMKYA